MTKLLQRDKKYNLLLTAILILIVGIVIVYSVIIRNELKSNAFYAVQQNTQMILREISEYNRAATSGIQLTSNLTSNLMSSPVLENADSVLLPFLEQTPFNFIEYIEADGMNRTGQGEPFDASDREYYKNGIKGKTGVWVNFHPKYSAEPLLNYYTPLYYENEIVGVLTGTLGAESNIKPKMQSSFFGMEMYSVLCDEDGEVIATNIPLESGKNLSTILSWLKLTAEDKNEFLNYLTKADGEAFEINSEEGTAIGCIQELEDTNWSLILLVPAASFNEILNRNTQNDYLAIFIICVVLFLMVFLVRMDSRKKQNKLVNEKDKAIQNFEQIMMTTASNTYVGIRRVDLETGATDYLYFTDHHVVQRNLGDWMQWLEKQKQNVHEDDYDRIHFLMDINNMRCMKVGSNYSASYRSAKKNEEGFYNTYTTSFAILELDGKKTAVLTTMDNTAVLMAETRQKKILSSVAGIYVSVHVLDLKENRLEVLHCSPHIAAIIGERTSNVKEVLQDVMRKMTDEQYMDDMMEFIDFSTLDERMKELNTITMEFVGNKSGWCRARFIAVDYDEDGKLSRVLWLVENIDADKRKTNHLLYLSETDLMTGIRNRGSGERKIKEYMEANRQGMFCLLDVDKFKQINDEYGHAVGDKVLIEVARCLKEAFHDGDVVMRLGGDEFAVFALGVTEINWAMPLLRDFFGKLEEINIPELHGKKIRVSLGAAFKVDGDDLDFESLYKNADSCTYLSKKVIGNTYTFYGQENCSPIDV